MRKKILFVFGFEPWLLPPALDFIEVLIELNKFEVEILYVGDNNDEELRDFPGKIFRLNRKSGIGRLLMYRDLGKKISEFTDPQSILVSTDLLSLHALTLVSHKKKIFWCFEIINKPGILNLSDFNKIRSQFLEFFCRDISLFITPSESRSIKLANRVGFDRKHLVVLNTRKLGYSPRKKSIIEKKQIIYSGRLSDTQYVIELVKSMLKLPNNYHLKLIGRASEKYINKIYSVINQLNLEDRVTYGGELSRRESMEEVSKSDLGVVFYQYKSETNDYGDPAPNKIGDYIACGIPILATKHEYLWKWVHNTGVGLCLDEPTDSNISRNILHMLESDNYQYFLENIHQLYMSNYNMNIQVIEFLNSINE